LRAVIAAQYADETSAEAVVFVDHTWTTGIGIKSQPTGTFVRTQVWRSRYPDIAMLPPTPTQRRQTGFGSGAVSLGVTFR